MLQQETHLSAYPILSVCLALVTVKNGILAIRSKQLLTQLKKSKQTVELIVSYDTE